MKWKYFATLVFVLVFCAALCLSSYAIGIPENTPVNKSFNISADDLMEAENATLVLWRPSSGSITADFVVVDTTLSKSTSFISGKKAPADSSWVQMFYTGQSGYTDYSNETIIGIRKLYEVDNATYDYWISQTARIEFYGWDAVGDPISEPLFLDVVPYYADAEGNLISDSYHAVRFTYVDKEIVNYGGSIYSYTVDMSGDDLIAVTSGNIPDGYTLFGFGYRWHWTHGLPNSAYFYLSDMDVSLTITSNATTEAINQGVQRILDAIAGLISSFSSEIKAQTEELINGWNGGGFSSDGSGLTDYEGAEKDLLDSQQSALDQSTSILNGVGGSLSKFENGFVVVGNIFNQLIGVEWVDTLITVSLALGIVAFLLNITPSIVKRLSHRNDKGEGG